MDFAHPRQRFSILRFYFYQSARRHIAKDAGLTLDWDDASSHYSLRGRVGQQPGSHGFQLAAATNEFDRQMNANDRNKDLDLRNQPAYGLAEASRYLKLPAATLRSWVIGRPYPKADGVGHSRPLIHPPKKQPLLLTFWNLIEAHVLRSLRTEHGVSINAVRQALTYAERSEKIERLLLRKDLRTNAGKLLVEKYGELIDLSASGQLAMRRIFEEHLKRVEWDEWQFPVRLYPFVSGESERRPIAIDPKIAFGRPVVLRAGVSTGIIVERIDAGESPADLADDYNLSPSEIEEAILYERAA